MGDYQKTKSIHYHLVIFNKFIIDKYSIFNEKKADLLNKFIITKQQVFVCLHIPFFFDSSFDESFCLFPYINGEVPLVPGMFFTHDQIKVP